MYNIPSERSSQQQDSMIPNKHNKCRLILLRYYIILYSKTKATKKNSSMKQKYPWEPKLLRWTFSTFKHWHKKWYYRWRNTVFNCLNSSKIEWMQSHIAPNLTILVGELVTIGRCQAHLACWIGCWKGWYNPPKYGLIIYHASCHWVDRLLRRKIRERYFVSLPQRLR